MESGEEQNIRKELRVYSWVWIDDVNLSSR